MIGLRITLTKKANKGEAAIYEYILEKFGESYADAFREKLLNIFYLLSKHPNPEHENESFGEILILSR